MYFFSFICLAHADIHILDLASNPGLLKIKKDDAYMQTGAFKLIHVINFQNFRTTLEQIDSVASSLGKESDFQNILKTKIASLNKIFSNIIPKTRSKRSWEGLGSAIKWIAGNPDADDLRKINHGFEKAKDIEKQLEKNNNQQAEINRIFQDKINEISKSISISIKSKFNDTFNSLDIINLIFNINIVEAKLNEISEAIILAKLGLVAKNLLSDNELKIISDKISQQNLKFSSLNEMLSLLHSQIEYNDEIFYYHIIVPVVEEGYTRLLIEPIAKNNMEIKIDFNQILLKGDKTYAITSQYTETTSTIYTPRNLHDISSDLCIPQLARDVTGDCIFKQTKMKAEIKVIEDGKLLIKNSPEIRIFNTCGAANHTITGTYFVNFVNCSIILNGKVYENTVQRLRAPAEILPSLNLKINQRGIEPNLHELHELHIENLSRFENLETNQKVTTNIIITSTAFAVILIVGSIVVYLGTMIRRSSILEGEKLCANAPTTSNPGSLQKLYESAQPKPNPGPLYPFPLK